MIVFEGLTLEPGGVALVGGAGAGKSSFLRRLAAHPSRPVLLFSDPTRQLSGTCLTVRHEVAWGLENHAVPRDEMIPRVEEALARCGLTDLADRSPQELSGGQQQRVALASVLVLAPDILLMDEPVSMLDPESALEMARLARDLAAGGRLVVWATPRLEEVCWCSRWLALEGGRVVYDGPPAVLETSALEAPWTMLARRLGNLWEGPLPLEESRLVAGLGREAGAS